MKKKCIEEKELFLKIIWRIVFVFSVIGLFLILYLNENKNKEELISSFKDGKELVCKSKIVSLKNGFNIENEIFSNDSEIFNIKICRLRKET